MKDVEEASVLSLLNLRLDIRSGLDSRIEKLRDAPCRKTVTASSSGEKDSRTVLPIVLLPLGEIDDISLTSFIVHRRDWISLSSAHFNLVPIRHDKRAHERENNRALVLRREDIESRQLESRRVHPLIREAKASGHS